MAEIVLNATVLVLNRSYLPIHVTSARRAFALVYRDVARVVNEEYETFDFESWRRRRGAEGNALIGTPSGAICVPRVILLPSFDRVPKRHVRYSRVNVFARDKFTCQYCGDRPHRSELNLDHVIPRCARGAYDLGERRVQLRRMQPPQGWANSPAGATAPQADPRKTTLDAVDEPHWFECSIQ